MPPSLPPPLNCLILVGTVANYGLVASVVLAEMLLGKLKQSPSLATSVVGFGLRRGLNY